MDGRFLSTKGFKRNQMPSWDKVFYVLIKYGYVRMSSRPRNPNVHIKIIADFFERPPLKKKKSKPVNEDNESPAESKLPLIDEKQRSLDELLELTSQVSAPKL